MPVTGPQHAPKRVSSGGSGFNIGPIASIGPGGEHAGRIVGWKYLTEIGIPLAAAGGAAGLTALKEARKRRVKDFNDDDTTDIEGSSGGKPVGGMPGKAPAGSTPGSPWQPRQGTLF